MSSIEIGTVYMATLYLLLPLALLLFWYVRDRMEK